MIALHPILGLPLIEEGDDLIALVASAMEAQKLCFESADVLVVTQKIVSKAAGLIIDLADVAPSDRALQIAATHGGDPRHIEVVLRESREVVVVRPNLLITEHLSGAVMANGGVDRSNISSEDGRALVAILPRDPDSVAATLRGEIRASHNADVAVIISDSWGRPWRLGTTGSALGAAGFAPLRDLRGTPDLFGAPLQHSLQAVGDELAGAANLVMGQAAERVPAVLIRGFEHRAEPGAARDLQRPRAQDVFR